MRNLGEIDCNASATAIRKPEPRRRLLSSAFRRVPTEQEPEHIVEGGSALFHATHRGYISTLRLLLAYDADTSLLDECGKTALEWASENRYREIEQLLMDHDESLGRSIR
jgi:ankyrin repeat protein